MHLCVSKFYFIGPIQKLIMKIIGTILRPKHNGWLGVDCISIESIGIEIDHWP